MNIATISFETSAVLPGIKMKEKDGCMYSTTKFQAVLYKGFSASLIFFDSYTVVVLTEGSRWSYFLSFH